MKNILILSAGRRVELVQHFRRAARTRPGETRVRVIAADARALAPALYVADDWTLLERADSPGYVEHLIDVIKKFDVGMVIPTIDPELPVLAYHRDEIEEKTRARVLVAEPDIISMCNDKTRTWRFLQDQNIGAPELFDDPLALDDSAFPVFLKPRAGSSGIGATAVHTREELVHLLRVTDDPMVQELATGQEYTVDCFSSLDGSPLSVVPRVRVAVRSGEILQGRIERNGIITSQVRQLLTALRVPGPSTVQCFLDGTDVRFIEINPRFGGGAPMSIAAGADSCSKLLRLMEGEQLTFDDSYTDGLTFLRFDQAICLDAEGKPVRP